MTTYAGQGAILPPHQINFRDLISSVPVQNGSYTFYREGAVTNSFAQQTELNLKASQDYTWVENRVSCVYISAITQFSKQLSYNLNFIQNTIATQLLRDFYSKENDFFNVTVAGNATGNGTVTNPSATVDAEELIGIIANQIKSGMPLLMRLLTRTNGGGWPQRSQMIILSRQCLALAQMVCFG
jgi:hypothetical protein